MKNEHQHTTMCIIHKGFKGFRALSPASILGGKLIGLKAAIPYEIIHSTLYARQPNFHQYQQTIFHDIQADLHQHIF